MKARGLLSSTLCVHGGEVADPATGAIEPPVHFSNAFEFESADQAAAAFRGESTRPIYTRLGNPTVAGLEAKVVALEAAAVSDIGDIDACVTASGMAAIAATMMTLCKSGDGVVAPRSMYAESARMLRERLCRGGIDTVFVDQREVGAYEAAIGPSTKVLYVETPANPTLILTDIDAIVALGQRHGLRVVIDSTFATPYCLRPLEHGVDIVLHSMTKQLSGHGDVLGGVIVGRRALVREIRDTALRWLGAALSPLSAMLIGRGMRTFCLRARQSCATAMALANVLAEDPRVLRVHYPGHFSHPQHALARTQMTAFGAMLSFEVAGGVEHGRRVIERCRLATHAVSLGDVRSLITHPASTTHASMPPMVRRAAGIGDGLLRLSCGIEETEDLVDDIVEALDEAPLPR